MPQDAEQSSCLSASLRYESQFVPMCQIHETCWIFTQRPSRAITLSQVSLSWPRLLPFLQPANIEGPSFSFQLQRISKSWGHCLSGGSRAGSLPLTNVQKDDPSPDKKPHSHLSAGVFPFLSKTKEPLAAQLSCNFPQLTLKKGGEKHAVSIEPLCTKNEDTVFPYLFWETSSSLNT